MKSTWHLIKKDLLRLRLPLVLFSLIVAGKSILYAAVSGLVWTPNIEWLRRLMDFPETLLRGLVEPVMAYLLVGWVVFDDSPFEHDAHWITRPISGGQLFTAKLAGAVLCFVLWPLLLNLPWWAACGFNGSETAVLAAQRVGVSFLLMVMALACAALTDGFARFILWSLVGIGTFGMTQLILASFANASPANVASRFTVCGVAGAVTMLAVAGHQFATRRHRRSLVLLGAGFVLTSVLGVAWKWNFLGARPRLADESPASVGVAVQLAAPVQTRQMGARYYAQVPLQFSGLPPDGAVGRLTITGNWSFAGQEAWVSRTGGGGAALWDTAIRKLLGLPAVAPAKPHTVDLPFSEPLAERAAHDPATLRASLELELFHGTVLAEMPLRETIGPVGDRACSISQLSTGLVSDRRPGAAAPAPAPKSPQYYVSLLLTERVASSVGGNTVTKNAILLYKLVNRRTGEIFAPDPTRSGPEALAVMDQATVFCWRMSVLVGATPPALDDLTLAIVQFDRGELLKRELKIEPVPFAGDAAEKHNAAAAPAKTGVARMAELVRAQAAGDRFMGSVLVARAGAVIFEQSTGWADLGQKAPNTANTRFRIGSLTKQFTAAAILLLEERGRLSVDDLLGKFMPDIPESWRSITLRHLLTHTSGILNFTNLPEYAAWEQAPLSPAEMVDHLRDRPLDFPPGEKFKYSNTGYVLLGRVVELASGQDYGTFLRDQVFLPLGMKDSGYEADVPTDPARAQGYVRGRAGPVPAGFIDMHVPGGAGGLYSTTGDLLRWTGGLFGGRLLKPASLEQMTTPVKNGYAFGLGISTVDGRKVIAHAGAIDGFISQLSYFPEEKMTVAVLANIGGAPAPELARQLADVAFGQTVTLAAERKEVAVPVETLQRYVGVYQLAPGVTNTVRLAGDQLTAQLSGQRAFPVFPESERKFFLKAVDAQVEFVLDDQGRVTHLLQFQNGRTQAAQRISDTVIERTAIALPRATLAAYVGVYALRPDFDITITLHPERDQLLAQGTGQPPAPLFAETETKFFSKVVDVQADFVTDANGAVTHLVLHQGGRDTVAPRKP